MQFVDLAAQQQRVRKVLNENIQRVLAHGKYINGPEVGELEKKLAEYVGVPHAVACSSGTDALLLALMAHGVGPGDAIFTTPFTFIATAEVICLLGATPIFVDIDPRTFNMDPALLNRAIDELGGVNPKGIIAVDLFGLPQDYDVLSSIATTREMILIEDAAQSFGATYKNQRACSFGEVACTSFFPAKPLGCYGDGGMCFTRDSELADRIRSLTVHGKGTHKYDNVRIGINGRLDTMQAAILLAKFDVFASEIDARQEVARIYTELLGTASFIRTPQVPDGYVSAWAQYSVLAENEESRSATQAGLKGEGIPTAIYYPRPLHQQTAFADLGYGEGDFPVSEDISQRIFSLPMHPYLGRPDQEKIVSVLSSVRTSTQT